MATIWDCCSVDKIFKLLCDFGLFVWITDDYKYLRFERIVEQMKQAQGITEQLKAENQMEWVARMNNIQACAREIVEKEIIVSKKIKRNKQEEI